MASQPSLEQPPVLYHVLLALRDPDEDELDPVRPTLSLPRALSRRAPLTYHVRWAAPPARPPLQTVRRSRLEDLTVLEGGMTLEYYAASNCGLVSYFVVRGRNADNAIDPGAPGPSALPPPPQPPVRSGTRVRS